MTALPDHGSPRLIINTNDILYNYAYLRNAYPNSLMAVVVKANAYGMEKSIVKLLNEAGCNDFFVATHEEGVIARSIVNKKSRVYIFHGLENQDLGAYAAHNLISTLNTVDEVKCWHAWGLNQITPPPACIHIDTGMNRLGLSKEDVKTLAPLFQEMDIPYVMTHLPCGRHATDKMNKQQLDLFLSLTDTYMPGVKRSVAASNILSLSPDYALDMIRQGLNLYGAYAPTDLENNPLRFSLKLQAKIHQVRHVNPGDFIGYNATYKAEKPMRIAVIGIGYADGLPYALSNRGGCCLIESYAAPIIGAISMDLTTIDVTNIPENISSVNDWVDLFHDNMSLYELAKKAGSHQHEMLSRLSTRCKRHYVS